MIPVDSPFANVPNAPKELEDVDIGAELVGRGMSQSSMELDEHPRDRKRRKSIESLGSSNSMEEMRALIKTEVMQAFEQAGLEKEFGSIDQMKQLHARQQEMRDG